MKKEEFWKYMVVEPMKMFKFFVKTNTYNAAVLINNVVCPFLMLYIGQYVCSKRGYMTAGAEILVPLFVLLMTMFMKRYARLTKSVKTKLPVPDKRFTVVEEDGEVFVKQEEIQEIILYLADLEDYLERTGRM